MILEMKELLLPDYIRCNDVIIRKVISITWHLSFLFEFGHRCDEFIYHLNELPTKWKTTDCIVICIQIIFAHKCKQFVPGNESASIELPMKFIFNVQNTIEFFFAFNFNWFMQIIDSMKFLFALQKEISQIERIE